MDLTITFAIMIFMFVVPALMSGASISYKHLRGTQLTPLWQVQKYLARWKNDPQTLVWGRFRVPLRIAENHFLVAGTTRSGKTILLRLLMQSVFPQIGQGESHRALIYDGKGELLNILLGIKQTYQQLITFNPQDTEGARWDIAKDVTDDASANQVASLLFPKHDSEHQPFFSEAVQNIAANLMMGLNEIARDEWRLSHLIFIMRSVERMKAVLRATDKGREMLGQYEDAGEAWGSITATISNRIRDYEIVAALHDHADRSFSIKEWNEGESILVLSKSSFCPEVTDAMNRVLFTLAKRRLLSKPPSPRRRTWLIFDELASIKSKEIAKDLGLLLEQGANRNISVALAFQSISSMRDEFGQHGADRLVALCGVKALLRFEDGVSSAWAAEQLGKQELRMKTVSSTSSGGGGSSSSGTTTSYQDQEKWVVYPSEFIAIPKAGADHGVTGYFGLPLQKPLLYKDTIPKKWVFSGTTLAPEAQRVVVERPDSQQRLQLTDADIEQLLKGRVQLGATPSTSTSATTGGMAPTPPTNPQAPPAQSIPAAPANPVAPPSSVAPPVSPNTPTTPSASASVPPTPSAPNPAPSTPLPQSNQTPPQTPPPGSSSPQATSQTTQPQVWNLPAGTVQPASIWSVGRTT